MMITLKKPKNGDIVTFHYNNKHTDVKAVYCGIHKFKSADNTKHQRPILKLLEDISYTSTHHAGETFKKDSEVNFLDPELKTINGKLYFKTIINRLKWRFLYGYR